MHRILEACCLPHHRRENDDELQRAKVLLFLEITGCTVGEVIFHPFRFQAAGSLRS
jgi:hypothetical protein